MLNALTWGEEAKQQRSVELGRAEAEHWLGHLQIPCPSSLTLQVTSEAWPSVLPSGSLCVSCPETGVAQS